MFPHEWRQSLKRRLFHQQDVVARHFNLRRAGFQPRGAIDGGAYHGDWSRDFWKVWPGVPVLFIEPQLSCRKILKQCAARVPGSLVASCALGERCGSVSFTLGETNSGIRASDENHSDETVQVPLRTLDSLLEENKGFLPNFLKLDLQGYDVRMSHSPQPSVDRQN